MKDSTVSARVELDVKTEAEDILQKLGVPVSVVINSLYRKMTSNITTAPRRTVTSASGLIFSGWFTIFLCGYFTVRFTLKIDPSQF